VIGSSLLFFIDPKLKVGSSASSDGHQEIMKPAKYIELAKTREKRSSRFFGANERGSDEAV
jgi:hypothetical protein